MNRTLLTCVGRMGGLLLSGAVLSGLLSGCGGQGDEGDSSREATPVATTPPPAAADDSTTITFETVDQKVSYGLGYNFGASIANEGGIEVGLDALMAGVEDGLKFADPRLDQEDLVAAFTALQERAQQAATTPDAAARLAAEQQWLRENGRRAEVTVRNSGLQYEVLESGSGESSSPGPTSTVEVHYHGTLTDGTVFDSSVERGESISFRLDRVIAGWTEALQLMSVGDKWRLYIPPHLGYGERGSGRIPANSALIFEVELIAVQ